jgi:hypothetical protein
LTEPTPMGATVHLDATARLLAQSALWSSAPAGKNRLRRTL